MLSVHERDENGITCVEGIVGGAVSRVFLFLVDGMLIDTGSQSLEADLREFYASHFFHQVVLTHGHEDHVGTAALLAETTNIPIYLHPSGIEACALPADYPQYRRALWGVRRPFRALPLGQEIATPNSRWEVIHTPGHAVDHVALLNTSTGVLFSGDLYLAPKVKLTMPEESIPLLMQSLRNLLKRDFHAMYCSHAGYVENGRHMLQTKLDYMEELSEKILRLHEQGLSAKEIDAQLNPSKPSLVSVSQGEYDTLHVVQSVLQQR